MSEATSTGPLLRDAPSPPGEIVSIEDESLNSIDRRQYRDVQEVLRENERLKKQLKNVTNLGRMVADVKQSNLQLAKENSELQEQLSLMQCDIRYRSGQPYDLPPEPQRDPNNTTNYLSESSLNEETEEIDGEHYQVIASKKLSKSMDNDASLTSPMTLYQSANDALENVAQSASEVEVSITELSRPQRSTSSLLSKVTEQKRTQNSGIPDISVTEETSLTRNSLDTAGHSLKMNASIRRESSEVPSTSNSLSKEINDFNEVVLSGNDVSQFEVRQLEKLLEENDVPFSGQVDEQLISSLEQSTGGSISVTTQFAKLATIFAGLAQRVMQSQKRARHSQAFCGSLMRDNEKYKSALSVESKRVIMLKRQLEQKEEEIKQLAKQGSNQNVSKKERTAVKQSTSSSADTHVKDNEDPDLSSISDLQARSLVLQFQTRMKKLEGQRTEILGVNKQWHAQYEKLKQECDAKTAASKKEIQELNEQIAGKQKENAKKRKDIDVLLREAKKEIDILQRQKGDLAKSYAMEHSKVKGLLETIEKLKSDCSGVKAENQRLNQALEAAYSIHQNRKGSIVNLFYEEKVTRSATSTKDNLPDTDISTGARGSTSHEEYLDEETTNEVEDLKTQIEVLQQQVKIYREDFETERRDREKIQAEKQRLSEEMARMRDEMRALNQQVRAHEQDFRQERREKQRLQRQLSRITQMTARNDRPVDFYYDVDIPDAYHRRHPAQETEREHHRYRPHDTAAHRGEVLIQTAAPTDTARRFTTRSRANAPPPYSQDTTRHRRVPGTTTRRIRDGYLEPAPYDPDPEVVYPPGTIANQF